MGGLKYTPADYRNMLKMSSGKFLLVEGKDDKGFFRSLLYELSKEVDQVTSFDSIIINSAEDLIKADNCLDNRQKVELICSSIQQTPLSNKHIGFVDREFREFDISGVVEDKLNGHNVINGVVWSRGHSIENYCFDFFILHSPLREHSDIDRFDLALELFKKIFDLTLRLACAFSLAAEELGKLQRVSGHINWRMIEIDLSEVKLKPNILRFELVNKLSKGSITEEEYTLLIEIFYKWHKKIENVDLSCIRWLCHGHIGMNFIWASYGQCVYEVCKSLGFERPEAEVSKVLEAKERSRFRTCVSSWIRRVLDNDAEYPSEVLNFFGFYIG